MDIAAVRQLHDRQERREAAYSGARSEILPGLTRQVHVSGGWGAIVFTNLPEDDLDHVIAEQVAYFDALGLEFEWKVYGHDRPGTLGEHLLRNGFEEDEIESVMVLDLDRDHGLLERSSLWEVRRIDDRSGLHAIAAVFEAVRGVPFHDFEQFASELEQNPEYVSFFVAEVNGIPVSTARVTFTPDSDFAGLWGGSTHPDYRGRGLYTSLVAARAQEARRRGRRYLVVDAGQMSAPILRHLGFKEITTARAYTRRPQ